ncbi:TIGR02281 family clan AA aspartic protease [Roseivivax marinus]|uniref:retropepsin-like aspartic protease family protein n=1 Tax=Roseivivax marinus TaxID=1379903 RepID=UPI001F040E51|nr:TIGR02281 family clan AA aspartic protease [Roseivivax marinus]UMA66316.1 TIGR02281 family clan AA aspartic protease [Roseivivax marinus]
MSGNDIGSLIYLVLLGAVLMFWLVVQGRQGMGRTLQQMAAWALIFVGVIAAVGLWGDIRQTVAPRQSVVAEEGRIVLPRAPDGHYYATLQVNGTPTRFMVDTGATGTVLTLSDAERAGLSGDDLAFYSEALTANGTVRTAPVTLDEVALGPFTDRDVPAYVNEGEMGQSLLGMSYLQRFGRIEIAGDELVLERGT